MKPPTMTLEVRLDCRFPCPFCDWVGPRREKAAEAFADLVRHLGHNPFNIVVTS